METHKPVQFELDKPYSGEVIVLAVKRCVEYKNETIGTTEGPFTAYTTNKDDQTIRYEKFSLAGETEAFGAVLTLQNEIAITLNFSMFSTEEDGT